MLNDWGQGDTETKPNENKVHNAMCHPLRLANLPLFAPRLKRHAPAMAQEPDIVQGNMTASRITQVIWKEGEA